MTHTLTCVAELTATGVKNIAYLSTFWYHGFSSLLLVLLFGLLFLGWLWRGSLFPSWRILMESQKTVEVSPPTKEGEGGIRRAAENSKSLADIPNSEVTTLYELMQWAAARYEHRNCLGSRSLIAEHEEEKEFPKGDGEVQKKKWKYYEMSPYKWMTYGQTANMAVTFGKGLRSLGMNNDTKLAMYSETCQEWLLLAQGCFSQSMTIVSIYPNLGEEGIVHALNEVEAEYVFTSSDLLPGLVKLSDQLKNLKHIIYKGKSKDEDICELKDTKLKFTSIEELERLGSESEEEVHAPAPEDLAALVYTSGTTGVPKGVMLTHANIVAEIAGLLDLVSPMVTENDVYIGYLPLAHIMELLLEHVVLYFGVSLGYANSRTLTDSAMKNCKGDMKELKPTIFPGVPTVFERIRKATLGKLNSKNVLQRAAFWTAYNLKKTELMSGRTGRLLDKLVFNKLKQELGGRTRIIVSAGAPLSGDLHWFLRICLCWPTIQAYGLSETSGAATWTPFDAIDVETAGVPVPCNEIKLVDVPELKYFANGPKQQGEIWIRGPNVSSGYFKNPDKTAEDFHSDGWFATGDIGEWTTDGMLKIIDRKKFIVKLAHGEYIALESLESKYKNSPFVDHICIHADSNKEYPIAIVVPNKSEMEHWASQHNISGSLEQIVSKKEAVKAVESSLKQIASERGLKSVEIPQQVVLTADDWEKEGLLTAAMKLKRHEIAERYRDSLKSQA